MRREQLGSNAVSYSAEIRVPIMIAGFMAIT